MDDRILHLGTLVRLRRAFAWDGQSYESGEFGQVDGYDKLCGKFTIIRMHKNDQLVPLVEGGEFEVCSILDAIAKEADSCDTP